MNTLKLTNKWVNAMHFAQFCVRQQWNARTMAELCLLAERANRAGVRECNEPGYSADPARRRFEARADRAGLEVKWPGLWPECYDSGVELRLPLI